MAKFIERLHRTLKEKEVWRAEYRKLEEAMEAIGQYLEESDHDRPHRGLRDRTPREAFLAFQGVRKIEALGVWISGV